MFGVPTRARLPADAAVRPGADAAGREASAPFVRHPAQALEQEQTLAADPFGASAELVAMFTIGAADMYGLPVSTTHILSSGIAGTMAANRSGLQKETLRNILLAWVFTLPACMILGSVLFAAGLFVVLRIF